MKENILVLDDDPDILDIFEMNLEEFYNVLRLDDSSDFRNLFNDKKIGIAIVDQHMEPKDGLSVLNEINEISPMTKKIMITGDHSSDLVVNAINKAQIDAFFYKPFEMKKILIEIKKLMNEYREDIQEKKQVDYSFKELERIKSNKYKRNLAVFQSLQNIMGEITEDQLDELNEMIQKLLIHSKLLFHRYQNDRSIIQLVELVELITEINLMADEYGIIPLRVYVNFIHSDLEILQNNLKKAEMYHSLGLNLFSKIDNNDIINLISPIIDKSVFKKFNEITLRNKDIIDYTEEHLSNLLSLEVSPLFEIYSFSKSTLNTSKLSSLAYIIVVKDHVTLFKSSITPIVDIDPLLVGNLVVAISDFAEEIFVVKGALNTIQHDGGYIFVHSTENGFYYIAVAYEDSIYYRVWLKEFARQTKNIFNEIGKSRFVTRTTQDKLDQILQKILEVNIS